jgi:hypothetical protein
MARSAKKKIPIQQVTNLIYLIRGEKVMLDSDLADLYGVGTKVLNQAVRRNRERFPADFMFQLGAEEMGKLARSLPIDVTSSPNAKGATKKAGNAGTNRSQFVTGSQKHRDPRYRPYVFTEQGVAMLSSVLRSPRAVQVNIEIMRTFVRLRQWLASNAELAKRLADLEKKYNRKFKVVFEALRQLMAEAVPTKYPPHREIGFHTLRESMRTRKAAKQSVCYS